MNRTTAATANNRRGDQRNQIKGMTQMALFAAVICSDGICAVSGVYSAGLYQSHHISMCR